MRFEGGLSASSQCVPLRQYSMAPVGATSSRRNGTMIRSSDTARSTSRRTCGEPFAPAVKITTNTRQPLRRRRSAARIRAWWNVARRDPATDPVVLEPLEDGEGRGLVGRRVTQEYIVCHGPCSVRVAFQRLGIRPGRRILPCAYPVDKDYRGGRLLAQALRPRAERGRGSLASAPAPTPTQSSPAACLLCRKRHARCP